MRVTVDQFLANTAIYTNFFRVFGYLVIENFFSREHIGGLREEWEGAFSQKFGAPYPAVTAAHQGRIIYSYIEKHRRLLEIYETTPLDTLVNHLAGPNSGYAGSDGSLFFGGSQWHRDWYVKLPSIKLACYLQPSEHGGGDFLLFPGSHLQGDLYADALGKACMWPEGNAGLRGDVLPVNFWDSVSLRRTDDPVAHTQLALPFKTIVVLDGDLLMFDNRLIHAASPPGQAYERRLLTMMFLTNPKDVGDEIFAMRNFTREQALEEVTTLKTYELSQLDDLGKEHITMYPEWMFDAARYPKFQPHLQMFKDIKANKQDGSVASMFSNAGSLAFFKQNYLAGKNPLLVGASEPVASTGGGMPKMQQY